LTPPAHAARTGYFFGSTPTAIENRREQLAAERPE